MEGTGSAYGSRIGSASAVSGSGTAGELTRKGRRGSLRNLHYRKDKSKGNQTDPNPGNLVGASRGPRRSNGRATTLLVAGGGEATEVSTTNGTLGNVPPINPADDLQLAGFDHDVMVDQELGGFGNDLLTPPPIVDIVLPQPPADFGAHSLSDSEHDDDDDDDYDDDDDDNHSGSDVYSQDEDGDDMDDLDDDAAADDGNGIGAASHDDGLNDLSGFDHPEIGAPAFDVASKAAVPSNNAGSLSGFAAHTTFDDSSDSDSGDSDESEP